MTTESNAESPDLLRRIADKLAKAKGSRIFGAQGHRFELGPPLDERELVDFERHRGILLPADYRAFVTQIGHDGPGKWGGAGPFWGLLPLRRWDEALVQNTGSDVLKVAFPFAPGCDYGADWLDELGLTDDGEEWFPGAIALGHLGCGDLAALVVTGAGRGRVAYVSWSGRAPVYARDPDFLAWYERWLDAALAGEFDWC